ncbi:hypothetical protein VPH35_010593 [Triticum aestivum]
MDAEQSDTARSRETGTAAACCLDPHSRTRTAAGKNHFTWRPVKSGPKEEEESSPASQGKDGGDPAAGRGEDRTGEATRSQLRSDCVSGFVITSFLFLLRRCAASRLPAFSASRGAGRGGKGSTEPMGCAWSSSSSPSRRQRRAQGYEEPAVLAAETSFTVSEVEALYELYNKLSYSIFKDGLIHKEEFRLALFRTSERANLFADRVFHLFDLKRNGVIEFGEFVRSLSIFHPKALVSDKAAFAFKLYDLRGTGYIEKEETFSQADTNGDGRLDPKEWEEFVKKNPTSLRNMSLPYLQDITTTFPSFATHSEVNDCGGVDK